MCDHTLFLGPGVRLRVEVSGHVSGICFYLSVVKGPMSLQEGSGGWAESATHLGY